MSDYAERIESIANKLRVLLEESEQLKQLVEQRMMLEEDTDVSEQLESEGAEEEEEEEEVPVVPELVTRKPWCWLCCRRY